MKRFLVLTLIALFAQTGPANAIGSIYEDYTIPVIATNMKPDSMKDLRCAEGKVVTVMGLIEIGEAGIRELAQKAGITQIHHVDMNVNNIIIVRRRTITVYGE